MSTIMTRADLEQLQLQREEGLITETEYNVFCYRAAVRAGVSTEEQYQKNIEAFKFTVEAGTYLNGNECMTFQEKFCCFNDAFVSFTLDGANHTWSRIWYRDDISGLTYKIVPEVQWR